MLRQAWSEVRLHPGRFLSTVLAVAISVAFLAGSAVLVATEAQAEGRALNVPIANADVLVEQALAEGAAAIVNGFPGVAEAAPILNWTEPVSRADTSVLLQFLNVPPDALRWSRLAEGRWPAATAEVVLSQGAAQALGVRLGGELTAAADDARLVVVGLTDEPSSMFVKTAYAHAGHFARRGVDPVAGSGSWAVKAAPGTDPVELAAGLGAALAAADPEARVLPAEAARERALAALAGDFEVFMYLLWAFAAVALVVGMITIANTFTITLAQRRRQIGLLRAVGAGGNQVRSRFLAEALILGLVGSLLGVAVGTGLAAAGSAYTGALFWGLALPPVQLGVAVGLGIAATLGAAWLPILRGTRVLPLEALQPVPSAAEQRRGSTLRAVSCGLLLAAGAGLVVVALTVAPIGFFAAIGAGTLISLGVLFGAPLFVPALLKLSGRLVERFGTTSRLAARNAERNPRRAAATASALMLAVGMIVTLQVGTASIRLTMLDEIERDTPVDISVTWSGEDGLAPAPAPTATRLGLAAGVQGSVSLAALSAEVSAAGGGHSLTVLGFDPAATVVTGTDIRVRDDEVLVDPDLVAELGAMVTVRGSGGQVALKPVGSRLVGFGEAMVSAPVLARLGKPVPAAVTWLSVPDRSRAVEAIVAVTEVVGDRGQVSGSIAMAANIEQVLGILLAITTALLGVAVLIALIGVSNTLGLSVLERSRESALLRALGLQARSLRSMLTVEALQVTLVGVLVGVVAGTFFGWLAVTSLSGTMRLHGVRFAVEVPQTLGMLALAVVAAGLASVLPGRRAASASPTEALAEV